MTADRVPSFTSLFNSQFRFGKDGKLTGRPGGDSGAGRRPCAEGK